MPNSVCSAAAYASSLEDSLEWSLPPETCVYEDTVDTLGIPLRKVRCRKMYFAAAAVLFSAVCAGMTLAYSSPATADMKRHGNLHGVTDDDITWIGSVVILGSLAGGITAGYLADKLGRKDALVFSHVLFTIGWLCIAHASNVQAVFVGRFLTGMCTGIVLVSGPIYLVEISTPEIRGSFVASFHVCVVFGMLFVVLFGLIFHWTWLAVTCLVVTILALIFVCPIPESPRWFIAHGQWKEAMKALIYFQGDYFVAEQECIAIEADIRQQTNGRLSRREIMRQIARKPAIVSLQLMFFQQASGVSPILFYTVLMLNSTGSNLSPLVEAIIVYSVQVVFTVISSVLIDRIGRRMLLYVSGLVMALSLLGMGVYELLISKKLLDHKELGWIPLVSLVAFFSSYAMGYGPVPALMVPEMTPVRARGFVTGIAVAFGSALGFFTTSFYDKMTKTIYRYGTYFVFAFFCLLSLVFVRFQLPETKGKRLEEIQLRNSYEESFTKQEDQERPGPSRNGYMIINN